MTIKNFKRAITVTFALLILASVSRAQAPKVRFYPYGDLKLCKGCGHLREDYWRLKFRLENVSGEDIVVYGRGHGDEWDYINQVQYRNPHVCDWQYSYGTSEKRVLWRDMPSSEKVPMILKAGGFVESERGILDYNYQPVTRFTTYVASQGSAEADEVFSEPYVGVRSADSGTGAPGFRIVADTCSPQCTIGIDRSPEIGGIRLGMSLANFRSRFPKVKIHRLHKNVVNFKSAYVWEWDQDAYSVRVNFLDDEVARIEASIRSLDGKRRLPDFFELVAEKIKLPFWPRYRSGWECKEFVVDVLTNEQPTITIETKAFIKVQAMLAERDIKKRK
jgi:hypothetical protein